MTPDEIEILKKKAKNQHTSAIAMVTVGSAMIVAGIAGAVNSEDVETSDAWAVVALVGINLNLGSIPFTIMAAHNRKKIKQASVSLATTATPNLAPAAKLQTSLQPGLKLCIPLGR